MTLPLAAHGVGTDRFSRCASGIRWSIWDSVRRVLGQHVLGGGDPLDLHTMEAAHLLGHPRGRDRQRDPASAPLGGDEVEDHEQTAVVADQLAVLVDEADALGNGVEAYAERRP
jgi:hypothetical protein